MRRTSIQLLSLKKSEDARKIVYTRRKVRIKQKSLN